MAIITSSNKILFSQAEKMGLHPKYETHYGLFSIQIHGRTGFVFYTRLHCNSRLGVWMAKNKHVTHIVLERNGIKMIPYRYSMINHEIISFLISHGPLIQKPLLGRAAQNVLVVNNAEMLKTTDVSTNIYEVYLQDVYELRYLVLEDEIIGVQKKILQPDKNHPWKKHSTNLERKQWDNKLAQTAKKIANVLHLGFAAVDFLIDSDGTSYVLEVNTRPDLTVWYHPQGGKAKNIGKLLLESIIRQ